MKPYSIRGLRLVGFHNFEDETISITGDLFVLGVNESGKTTVLDAIQLALNGGQDFEWNAAARLDGSRRDGRSLQGVILRADLSGAPHRQGPNGGPRCFEGARPTGHFGPASVPGRRVRGSNS